MTSSRLLINLFRSKFALALALFFATLLVASCGGKEKTLAIPSNCKLPVADGSSGVAITGFPRSSNRLASTGTVKATVIMVDFPDAIATLTPAQAYAKISGASATFTEMSYGKFNYSMTPVLQWFRMSKNSSQYGFNTYQDHHDYLLEAVTLANPTVDFSSTDSLVVLTNPDASGIGTKGPAMAASPGTGITADGKEMLNMVSSAYDLNTWGSIWLNHEVTHTLGLVDLYAATTLNSSDPYDNLRYAGTNSYMAYNSFSANAPGLTAWERWVLGWVTDDQIQCEHPLQAGEINALITPIEVSGGKKAVIIPVGATKVVVVESRRRSGIDAGLAKEGALVYVVDSSLATGKGPIQIFPKLAGDPYFRQSYRAAGESVSLEGLTVQVVSSTSVGDTVRISANTSWFHF